MAVRKQTDGPSADDQRKIFLHLIQDTYQVGCAPGAKQTFTMNRRFVDTYGCFYPHETLVDDKMIEARWKALGKTWNFDMSNPYVQMWLGV